MNNLNETDAPVIVQPVLDPEVDLTELDEPVLEPELELRADDLPMRFACFVTGTDTEIGKTLISAAILHKLVATGQRACGMKPVAAGAELRDGVLHNDDADQLIAAGNVHLPASLTTPYLLREPAAPHIAAALEGVTIELVPILAAFAEVQAASDAVVVEGVGGFRVPFNDDFDSADLAAQLNLPVILVVGVRLGCISHALLTAEAIARDGLVLAGWVANIVDAQTSRLEANLATLTEQLPAPCLGQVPRLLQPVAESVAQYLTVAPLLALR